MLKQVLLVSACRVMPMGWVFSRKPSLSTCGVLHPKHHIRLTRPLIYGFGVPFWIPIMVVLAVSCPKSATQRSNFLRMRLAQKVSVQFVAQNGVQQSGLKIGGTPIYVVI